MSYPEIDPKIVEGQQGDLRVDMFTSPNDKVRGAYYTPDAVARSLVSWVVRGTANRLLDPSCGDGRFLRHHPHSVGIELDASAAKQAMTNAPWALVHQGDFFTLALRTNERFDCIAGNPPFIRYQTFKGDQRKRALAYCSSIGVDFNGLASAWAPFVAAASSMLEQGGRMALVVPAEIGHAPYAIPLIEYLCSKFKRVQIVAIRDKLFPDLSEDCWLLYAEGYGGSTQSIGFTPIDTFKPTRRAPAVSTHVSLGEWRTKWNCRLRPFILPRSHRDLYQQLAQRSDSVRLGEVARVGIGYVSGGNDFFHIDPETAVRFGIPSKYLLAAVRNSKSLKGDVLGKRDIAEWKRKNERFLLLRLPSSGELPPSVLHYLNTPEGHEARQAYKCRTRTAWYSVPDVRVPEFFLTYMSGRDASLVRNDARATCTNSLHAITGMITQRGRQVADFAKAWADPLMSLSREIEGHALGGGMLKIEVREAARIILASDSFGSRVPIDDVRDAVSIMRSWRHYADCRA